ncbi:MAG: ribosome small subunit-dependent GTPase A [Hominenteromicrobium sp.]
MRETLTGLVLKGIGGFYYVQCGETLYACRARGKFRKERISPYAGDRVRFAVDENGDGYLSEILPRKNFLVRPPLANLDKLFIVSSVSDPQPSTLIIDKTIAAAELKGIEPVLVFTKTDLDDAAPLREIYGGIGIRCYFVSSVDGVGVEALRPELSGCVSAFTGNSGVGKSTLLNALMPELVLETGEISKKLGRGRHTTRHVELYPVEGGYVADTPGFSTMDIDRYELFRKEELPGGFREFAPYLNECRFTSCSHTCEKGCAVLEAVEAGRISRSRLESYIAMYNEVKDIKEWQLSKSRNV